MGSVMMMLVRLILLLAPVMVMSGCAGNAIILPLAEAGAAPGNLQRIHVATVRSPSDDPLAVYSGARADGLSFADVAISVPRDREPGTIAYPGKNPDLKKQFAAVAVNQIETEQDFLARINEQLRRLPSGRPKSVLVFVHGYNTNFAASLFRQAQMHEDFDIPAVAVNYSWASAGRAAGYLYDRDSAQFARNGLRETLELLNRSDAQSVVLLGHSMGGLVSMEALRDLANRNDGALPSKLSAVILAAPDIDVNVFQSQLSAIRKLPSPFVIFVSSKDRALNLSQRVRGGLPRVGKGSDIKLWQDQGIAVVDLSTIEDGGDRTNHSTFASSRTIINLTRNDLLSRQTLTQTAEGPRPRSVSSGIGALSDVAASIIYLPARAAGVR